jgi:two-component system phosphate regulon response regulator OmpR
MSAVTNARILVVDDDPRLREMLRKYLEGEGVAVSLAADGTAMRKAMAERPVDLVLLDLVMPGEDGLTLAREVRARSDVPIIILSGKGDTIDRVVGLELGADDYIAKPFHLREVLARIKTVLRRSGAKQAAEASPAEGSLSFAGWRLDPAKRELIAPHGRAVELTTGEFDLLLAFARHPQRVLTRDRIMDLTKGQDWSPLDRSVDNQVRRLRRKIETDPDGPQLIKTVRGAGYLFAAPVSPAA